SEQKIKTLTWKKGRHAPTGLIPVLDATVLVEQFIRNHFKLLPLLRLGDLLQGLRVGDLLQLGARSQRVLLLPFLVLLPPLPLLLLVSPDLLLELRHPLLVRALQLLLLGPDVEGRPAAGDGAGGGSLGAGLLPLTAGDPASDDAVVGGATERGLLRILEGGERGPLGGGGRETVAASERGSTSIESGPPPGSGRFRLFFWPPRPSSRRRKSRVDA
ncbi:unnamed protein product, partial [Musa textilis]